jgi:hypothetical protein
MNFHVIDSYRSASLCRNNVSAFGTLSQLSVRSSHKFNGVLAASS